MEVTRRFLSLGSTRRNNVEDLEGRPRMALRPARVPISLKLILLIGIPIVGAMVLSFILLQNAQRVARSTEALGTVEDLAQLTGHISGLVHALEAERVTTALALATKDNPPEQLATYRKDTDRELAGIGAFMSQRNVASLPSRLARDLGGALDELKQLSETRGKADSKQLKIGDALTYYNPINQELISATAGLTQLSNDGELLRAITLLVSTLEVKERASQEHAVLSNVFAEGEFQPGLFRSLVTLVTEQEIYSRVLRSNATDSQIAAYEAALQDPAIAEATAMRKKALEATDNDALDIPAASWYTKQNAKIDSLRKLEQDLNGEVKRVAMAKVAETRRSVRTSLGVSAAVLVFSLLIASMIGRGVRRSVASLTRAATEVRERKDYGVRAKRVSSDEMADLGDAFNEMLAGIQERDLALAEHQRNLEQLVQQRTQELARRNTEMRVVLDTVEQGLVTLDMNGQLGEERSAAFLRWFPEPETSTGFESTLVPHDRRLQLQFRLSWEAVVEDMLPLELTLDQMPKRMEVKDRQFALDYRPIFQEGKLQSVLLIITDISAELARIRHEAEQREFLAVFERVMKDRIGFVEFFNEASALADELATQPPGDDALLLRRVHTLKGNAGIFGLGSVADICHALETKAAEAGICAMREALPLLVESWTAFAERIVPIIGTDQDDIIEIDYSELDAIAASLRKGEPHPAILAAVERLKFEPTKDRLTRIAEQAQSLAKRLGRDNLEVAVDAPNVRLPAERFSRFWSVFIHVVRNSVDHGLESPADRIALGKLEHGRLTLRASEQPNQVTIDVLDDGRGIDWDTIRERAQKLGLAHQTQQDLVRAIFADGVSSASVVTQTSGRGVGMGAVHDACKALGGTIQLASVPGKGTKITFVIPILGDGSKIAESAGRHWGSRPSLEPPTSVRPHSSSFELC